MKNLDLDKVTVGVVGNGVVGRATAAVMARHVGKVLIHDKDPERSDCPIHAVLTRSNVVFACLPTPTGPGGLAADLTAIREFMDVARDWWGSKDAGASVPRLQAIVLRSTVPVGTTEALAAEYRYDRLIHCPEFLTARTAYLDAARPQRVLVGSTVMTPRDAVESVMMLLADCLPGACLSSVMASESELVKLTVNSFYAVKVAFFNEVRRRFAGPGIDWDVVAEEVVGCGMIHPAHTMVPGPDGELGFGGACLPKDLASMVAQIGDGAHVTTAALHRNRTIDRPSTDPLPPKMWKEARP